MTTDELRERVAAIPYWYHRITLPGNIITPGWAPLFPAAYRVPERLDGLRVLDVGAWDGYWTWEALRRGAREVVAIDDFSDQGGHSDPIIPRLAQWETFDLCAEALGWRSDRVTRIECSVYDIDQELSGHFDVVFAFGLLYHCRHPLLALDRMATVCPRGQIYIESAVCDHYSPYRQGGYPGKHVVMEFYPGAELGRNATNWWAPTARCLAEMVKSAGWDQVNGQLMVAKAEIPADQKMPFHRAFVQGRRS